VARYQSVSALTGSSTLTRSAPWWCADGLRCVRRAIYAVGYFRTDFEKQTITVGRLKEYYTLTPLFVFALFLVALANNLGIMWVAIEGSTLASVLLIAFYNQKTSLEAAWKYIIIGSIGISMALFGTLLTYYAASHIVGIESIEGLNWTRLVSVAPSMNPKALRLAFIFILMGYGTKAGCSCTPETRLLQRSSSLGGDPGCAVLNAPLRNPRFHIWPRSARSEFPGLLLWFGLGSCSLRHPSFWCKPTFGLLAYSH
jgi:hydrogenase-4 component F